MSTRSAVQREFLWALWKIHILREASVKPVFGLSVLHGLQRRGYEVSPGTLYPLFARMLDRGWLSCPDEPGRSARARKEYRITATGRAVLGELRDEIARLHEELDA